MKQRWRDWNFISKRPKILQGFEYPRTVKHVEIRNFRIKKKRKTQYQIQIDKIIRLKKTKSKKNWRKLTITGRWQRSTWEWRQNLGRRVWKSSWRRECWFLVSLGPPIKEEEKLLLGFQFGRENREKEKTSFVFRCVFAFIHYLLIQ